MSPLSKDVPHFFKSGAPPPPQPILIAQTEIGYNQAPPNLLALEELGPGPTRQQPPRRPSPYRKSAQAQNNSNLDANRAARSNSESPSESSSESDGEDGVQLIPKPNGEAGRPGRGGYNVEESLGWPAKEYRQLKKFVKKHVKEQLEPSKSYSSQPLASVRAIQTLASDKFPALQGYANCWPIGDLIRLELKYTSGRARLQEQKDDAKAGKLLTKSSK